VAILVESVTKGAWIQMPGLYSTMLRSCLAPNSAIMIGEWHQLR
jgi:hypothetical protein